MASRPHSFRLESAGSSESDNRFLPAWPAHPRNGFRAMSLITFVTRIHFADRILEDALSEELSRLGIRRPFIVSDPSGRDGEAAGRLDDALPLSTRPVVFQSGGDRSADADLGVAEVRFSADGCDGVIGLGGASALDMARLLGRSGVPVIAVPTGSESVGLGPLGIGFARNDCRQPPIPAAIFCDATLTVSADPESTAVAGMDALVHCLEAYLSTAYNPPADGIALDGLRRAVANLPAAVGNGSNLDARRELLAAALNAGLAAQKGFGGVEAAARGLETEMSLRHGALHAAMLPAVLAFNAPAMADRLGAVRSALGLGDHSDVAVTLHQFAAGLGLPLRLSEAGIVNSVLRRAARRAAADPANQTNPRHATTLDYETMMRAAL